MLIGTDRTVVSGHSAGGHLALIMRTGDFSLNFELPADAVAGATFVGAKLDMEPILLVPGCEVLLVTAETLRELSSSCNPPAPGVPLSVAVGGRETRE